MLRSVLKNKNTAFGRAFINTAQRNFAYVSTISLSPSLVVLSVLILELPTPASQSWNQTIQKSLKMLKVSASFLLVES